MIPLPPIPWLKLGCVALCALAVLYLAHGYSQAMGFQRQVLAITSSRQRNEAIVKIVRFQLADKTIEILAARNEAQQKEIARVRQATQKPASDARAISGTLVASSRAGHVYKQPCAPSEAVSKQWK